MTAHQLDKPSPQVIYPTPRGVQLNFAVKGLPAPQGSKRYVGRSNTGKGIMLESSKRVPTWRADVREAAQLALDDQHPYVQLEQTARVVLWTSPIWLDLMFHLPRPRSHYGTGRNADILKSTAPSYPASTPDLDKLVRAVLDALTSVVWSDDGHVVSIFTSKRYAHPQQSPGVAVSIKEA